MFLALVFLAAMGMPEGPSIIILREELQFLKNKKIVAASGAAGIDFKRLDSLVIKDVRSWGKHLLICFRDFFIRIHLMMFGSYRINSRKEFEAKLRISIYKGEANFYTCQVTIVDQPVDEVYNWDTDIMSPDWKSGKVKKKIEASGHTKICDVLLDQDVFTGVGNIIKNEALFNARIHPESLTKKIPKLKIAALLKQTKLYSHNFYTWKKAGTLKKKWKVYENTTCPRCKIPLQHKYLGKNKRLSFFCNNCQHLYT